MSLQLSGVDVVELRFITRVRRIQVGRFCQV